MEAELFATVGTVSTSVPMPDSDNGRLIPSGRVIYRVSKELWLTFGYDPRNRLPTLDARGTTQLSTVPLGPV